MNGLPPNLLPHLYNTPLMLASRGVGAVLGAAQTTEVAAGTKSLGVLSDRIETAYMNAGLADRLLTVRDGIAVIGIEGLLVPKGGFIGSSWMTSYEALHAQISRASKDPNVKGVVFEVDSFGGAVAGAFDTAEMIAELSAQKPTVAILTDFAYSAGYLLASAARRIVVPESGGAGSIGVIVLHVDYSGLLAAEGIKATLLTSGAHKADGNPFEALPSDVAARYRVELGEVRDQFATAVGRYRGKRFDKAAALATEALDYRGPDAKRLGLVDEVSRPSEAFAAFRAEVNKPRTELSYAGASSVNSALRPAPAHAGSRGPAGWLAPSPPEHAAVGAFKPSTIAPDVAPAVHQETPGEGLAKSVRKMLASQGVTPLESQADYLPAEARLAQPTIRSDHAAVARLRGAVQRDIARMHVDRRARPAAGIPDAAPAHHNSSNAGLAEAMRRELARHGLKLLPSPTSGAASSTTVGVLSAQPRRR
jgi:capsid assembly protease